MSQEQKILKARVRNKHKTEAQWVLDVYTDSSKTELRNDPFIPLDGELIIFDKDDNYDYDRIKFGDGTGNVIELPFAGSAPELVVNKNQTNGNVQVSLEGDNTSGEFLVVGSGATVVTSDNDGKITVSSTDEKVTTVGNHYSPAADSTKELSIDASASSSAEWDVTSLVTGVNLQRDAAGHVVGVTVDSIKMPPNPDTNTEETLVFVNRATPPADNDFQCVIASLSTSGNKGHTLTPTYAEVPTKEYVDKVATGTVEYLGTVSALDQLSTSAGMGDFYRVSQSFAFDSDTAHAGDILLATKNKPEKNTVDWDLIHTNCDTNTWNANTASADGYVAKGQGYNNKVWKTDANGNPAWRDGEVVQVDAVGLDWSTYNASTIEGKEKHFFFKVCEYSENEKHLNVDFHFRIKCGEEYTRIGCNARYPFKKGTDASTLRTTFLPERKMFENGITSRAKITNFRLFERKDVSPRQIWILIEAAGTNDVTEVYLNTVIHGGSLQNIQLSQQNWYDYAVDYDNDRNGAKVKYGDSLNLTMSNYSDKTFIGNIDSHATAEGAAVYGENNLASGVNAFAGGNYTVASGKASVALGQGLYNKDATDAAKKYRMITASGEGAIAMGYHGDGKNYLLTASGKGAIALGHGTVATEEGAIGVGHSSQSKGIGAFAAGYYAKATKQGAVAIGYDITSGHKNAVAIGPGAFTGKEGQIVFGPYNATDTTSILVLGNGTGDKARKTIFTVAKNADGKNYANATKETDAIVLGYLTSNYYTKTEIDDMDIGGSGTNAATTDDIKLSKDIILTKPMGALPVGSKLEKDWTLTKLLIEAYSQDSNPSKTNPYITLRIGSYSGNSNYVDVGTKLSSYNVIKTDGSYTYGTYHEGEQPSGWNPSTANGVFGDIICDFVECTIGNETKFYEAKCNYSTQYYGKTQLGSQSKVKIADQELTSNVTIIGSYRVYAGTIDSIENLDATKITKLQCKPFQKQSEEQDFQSSSGHPIYAVPSGTTAQLQYDLNKNNNYDEYGGIKKLDNTITINNIAYDIYYHSTKISTQTYFRLVWEQ